MDTKHIYWLAGLLDGEGMFRFDNTTPKIQLKMTDEDIVVKARNLLYSKAKIRIVTIPGIKIAYVISIQGNLAIQWMMTIYSLMSRRRKERIREVILTWKDNLSKRDKGSDYCLKGHSLIEKGNYILSKNKSETFTKICKICRENRIQENNKPENKLIKAMKEFGFDDEQIKEKLKSKGTVQ